MNKTIDWLMDGDPAIRWQVQRDLLGAPKKVWEAERRRVAKTGWGAQLLARQEANGGWGGGVYSPKWISTTYTLLLLHNLGLPRDNQAARRGARLAVKEILGGSCDEAFRQKLAAYDRCIVGMMLQLGVYFGIDDERIGAIVDNLLSEQMPDGGWNCRRHRRPYPHHSSFHTTFNALEGLREFIENRRGAPRTKAQAAERRALELLLQHRMYKSDHTGNIINSKFTQLSFPYRWHYDVLRGLDYFARAGAPRDPRLNDAIALLRQKRLKDGAWPLQNKYSGKVFFQMEPVGKPSRWNTLRALRVLRWWEG